MAFYKPIKTEFQGTPVIVYPETGIESVLDRKKENIIEDHIMTLYKLNKNKFKTIGDYNIDFLWIDKKEDLMTDVWIQSETDSWGSGPLYDPKVFRKVNRSIKPDNNIERGSGNVILVLAAEETQRRNSDNFKSYIKGERPDLPFGLASGRDFYI